MILTLEEKEIAKMLFNKEDVDVDEFVMIKKVLRIKEDAYQNGKRYERAWPSDDLDRN